MEYKNNNKGFTLIELLIVILIVGVLSSLAVGGYSSYRRSALLDLGGDSIISQINEMRDKALHGAFGSYRYNEISNFFDGVEGVDDDKTVDVVQSKCFGIIFDKNVENNYSVNSFSQNFIGKKVFLNGEWRDTGCESDLNKFDASIELKKIDLDEMIVIEDLQYNSQILDRLVLRFSPPDGKMDYFTSFSEFSSEFKDGDNFKLLYSYGATEDLSLKRRFNYDFLSGKMFVEKIN